MAGRLGIVTEKLAFMNAVDKEAADQLAPLYTVDVVIARSKQKGNISLGFWVYRISVGGDQDLLSFDDAKLRRRLDRIREEGGVIEEHVEGPILVSEADGPSVLARAEVELRRLLDRYNNHCDLKVKAPSIKARCSWPKNEVRRALDSGDYAGKLRRMVDALRGGYRWDPWLKGARRGEISGRMSKR